MRSSDSSSRIRRSARSGKAIQTWSTPARKSVAELKAQGVNKIIALTHVGITFDRELARQVSGIQVIIGGHSHSNLTAATVGAQATNTIGGHTRLVAIGVRELGPTVKLLSSAALVEGGTEVVLHVTDYSVPAAMPVREFTVHWKHGGPGVVKGVASLASDMQAALRAGLQAGPAPSHR